MQAGPTARFLRTGLCAVASLVVVLWGCAGSGPKPGERRIFFSDDLRIHSLNPDGTGLCEFPGKHTLNPAAGPGGRVYFGSYRGPYWLVDEPVPGLYSADAAGRRRNRIADLPGLPSPFGLSSAGEVAYLLPGRPALCFVPSQGGSAREHSLPGSPVAAALSAYGAQAAVLLEPRMRTVVLGNQAWFTEGSDLLILDLATGRVTTVSYPLLPEELRETGGLEHYAGSGAAAVAWRGEDELLVSSAPGVWSLKLEDLSVSRLVVERTAGQPPPNGLAVSRDGSLLAYTCGGRLLLRDLASGREKDLTPSGVLVGGAHHPCWMEPQKP